MKILALAAALIVAVAMAPAEAAAPKKKKQVRAAAPAQTYMYGQRVPPSRQHPYGVYGADGELLGMDPDPNVRAMIRKDPKPWDNNS